MKRFLSVAAAVLVFSLTLTAQTPDAISSRAKIAKQGTTISGDRGAFTVSGSETLNQGQFSFGAGWSNYDRTPKDIDVNVIPVHLSYGLFRRLSVSAMFEAHKEVTVRNQTQPGFYNALPFSKAGTQTGVGDGTLAVKYKLQQKKDNVGGIALKGFVKFGSGNSNKGLGSEKTDVGGELLFTSLLPLKFVMHSSIGYVWTDNATRPFTRQLRDQLVTGLAAVWPAAGIPAPAGKIQGIVEYTSTSFVGCCSLANLAPSKIQNPTDVNAGIRYLLLDSGITMDAAYRVNTKFDTTDTRNEERNGLVVGVSYTKPSGGGSSNNRNPLVAVEASAAEVTGAATVNLTATGFDADNDNLTYTWTATGGQVMGTGPTATYRANGARPGAYVVRVLASDGKGGTASAEVTITVR